MGNRLNYFLIAWNIGFERKGGHVDGGGPEGKAWGFLLLNAGTILVAVGVYFFKFPNHFSMGACPACRFCWGRPSR